MENSTATSSSPNIPQNTVNVAGNTATTTINQKKMLYGINMLKHVVKKGGQSGTELRAEDLDENLLKARLVRIEQELSEYKSKCIRYKEENEWYRQEIETTRKDTLEYINYLESKKNDKKSAISQVNEENRKDLEYFNKKKSDKTRENQDKIQELKEIIGNLEEKIQQKSVEMIKLSDVMGRRARHDAEISKIRKEIQTAESEHLVKVQEIEKSLIESRFKVQKEADLKIQVMKTEAHDRAYNYLKEHTQALDEENLKLEKELQKLLDKTQEQLKKKHVLEVENSQLEREERLRQDLIRIRLERIQQAQIKSDLSIKKKKEKILLNRKLLMQEIISKGKISDGLISDGLDPLDLQWSDDDFSDV